MENEKVISVDAYIESFEPEIQTYLQEVRKSIKEALPDAVEKISWGMPTYWKGRNIIHFAGQKKHLGIYPGAEAVVYFSPRLDRHGVKYSKGAIRFLYDEPIPFDFIKEIAVWCSKEQQQHHSMTDRKM